MKGRFMSGFMTYGLAGLVMAVATVGAITMTEKPAQIGVANAADDINRLPIWQVNHPIFGECGLSTRPNLQKTELKLSISCRNAFPELGAAEFWSRDVADEITIYANSGDKIMSFSQGANDIYKPIQPSTSQLSLVPPSS